jgi:hypothetical protein
MSQSSIEDFKKLTPESKEEYKRAARQFTTYALAHTVPIVIGPPVMSIEIENMGSCRIPCGGKIEGASSCLLKLHGKVYSVTAEHVLVGYEERVESGERINWQVGRLRPFDPLERVAWRGGRRHNGRGKDIACIEISESEAREACAGLDLILRASTPWPPAVPEQGQVVFMAGHPTEQMQSSNGEIDVGGFGQIFRVTTSTGDGSFKCRFEYRELISHDDQALPMETIETNVGGMSGGPVFLMGESGYPLVGVISERGNHVQATTIVIEALEGLPSRFSAG